MGQPTRGTKTELVQEAPQVVARKVSDDISVIKPVQQHRVTFHRQNLAAMRFESGDGAQPSSDETVVWERRDFLAPDFCSADIAESRNLHASLSQLLETQRAPPDLSRFGDYGRILKSQPLTLLAKNLAPPGLVSLSLKYRQVVPKLHEAHGE